MLQYLENTILRISHLIFLNIFVRLQLPHVTRSRRFSILKSAAEVLIQEKGSQAASFFFPIAK
jgi:hypothetical protein